MISRTLVILLALVAAGMRVAQGAWVEATGLAALAGGLVLLRVAARRPAAKPYAWSCFLITAIAVVASFVRRY